MPDEDPKDNEAAETADDGFDAVQAAAELSAALADEAPASGGGNYTAILEDEVEALGRVVADKETALQAAQDKAAAASAEIDRVRARLERDAAATIERKRRDVLVSFLDVADDLDRAVGQFVAGEIAPALAQGVHLVRDNLHAVLKRHGVRRRLSLGEPFDPAHHEAMATVPATADVPDGTVADVLSEGYEIDEQDLRPARVVVAKA